MEKTSEAIKKLRKQANMTQKELAEKTGLSIATIQGYEQGKYKPKSDAWYKIATATNARSGDILHMSRDGVMTWEISQLVQKRTLLEKRIDLSSIGFMKLSDYLTLIDSYDALNKDGQVKLLEYAEDLTKISEYLATQTTAYQQKEIILNAAHEDNPTPEQKTAADDIMMNDAEWE